MFGGLCANFTRLRPIVVARDVPGAREYDREQAFRIVRTRLPVRRSAAHLPQMLARAAAEAARSRPAVVLASHVLTMPLAMALRKPWVGFLHGSELGAGWSARLAPRFLPRADALVANSHATADLAKRIAGPRKAMMVTPLGVDPKHFHPAATDLPAEWQLDEAKVLLTVARLDQLRKGHDVVLEALPSVARRVPNVRYVIAGEGPLRPELERRAATLGVAERCVFAGRVPERQLAALYERADVFVMPSRAEAGSYEGFGIVYVEAAAHGTPSVAGNQGGAVDAVLDGQTGLLVNPRQPSEVAEAASRLLTDDLLRKQLGEQARRRAKNELTWPKIAQRVEDFVIAAIA